MQHATFEEYIAIGSFLITVCNGGNSLWSLFSDPHIFGGIKPHDQLKYTAIFPARPYKTQEDGHLPWPQSLYPGLVPGLPDYFNVHEERESLVHE